MCNTILILSYNLKTVLLDLCEILDLYCLCI